MTEDISDSRTLIITIVNRGWGDTVIEASMKAGAEGGTVLFGRGTGIHEKKKIMGIPIEPEKDIVLTITPPNKTDTILTEIVRVARLGEPGKGIAFALPVDRFVGAVHTATDILSKEHHP